MQESDELFKYVEYLRECELSEGTIKVYERYAKQLLEYLGDCQVTKEIMMMYKKQLYASEKKAATINLIIVSINKYLIYIGYPDCILKTERIQKNKCLDNVLNETEYKAMIEMAKKQNDNKYYYIIRTLALTGIRISELRYFTVESLTSGRITVKNKGKIREVYIPDKLVNELYEYCFQWGIRSGIIFKGDTNKPLSRSALYKGIVKIARKVNIPKEKAHPHSFRHLFALTYMKQFSDITELADILGHSSLETTRIYTVTTAEEKRRKMNMLNF